MNYQDVMSILSNPDNNLDKFKVTIANIVFLQGDDYNTMESELNESDSPDTTVWLTPDKVKDYLMQWYDGDINHYPQDTYPAYHINTQFLGYVVNLGGEAWLYSKESYYAGLSKIISLETV